MYQIKEGKKLVVRNQEAGWRSKYENQHLNIKFELQKTSDGFNFISESSDLHYNAMDLLIQEKWVDINVSPEHLDEILLNLKGVIKNQIGQKQNNIELYRYLIKFFGVALNLFQPDALSLPFRSIQEIDVIRNLLLNKLTDFSKLDNLEKAASLAKINGRLNMAIAEIVNEHIQGYDSIIDSLEKNNDKAMGSKPETFQKGGIDFNPGQLNLQVRNSGQGIDFYMDPAMLQQFQNVSGFTPVIINIQPMTNLRMFLGLEEQKTNSVAD